ncbi:hypothetical protein CWE15_06550 [Aliidiomarina taiwanensis]|uniref:Flagellar hook-length control protein-like C-terminal domain-containing protein n=1 Tax=Aliidiomarina taiwanensis TaxID=946228 RepID=A0A432X8J7_9GAMM|nr:flagellar hook-length control protein FliK [Aliidiomarina taiwanensis]RUO43057.1 hypothetical protein CWE15_06550 [Aliidiomarina taiwanensis]
MDKLSSGQAQALLRQLLQAPPSSLLTTGAAAATTTGSYSPSAAAGHSLASSLSLQLPPALRQIVAQAQTPTALLHSLLALKDNTDLPPQLRAHIQALVQQASSAAEQPKVTPALVSAWFRLNPAAALLQAPQAQTTQSPGAGLWLQQALPLLLLMLRPHAGQGRLGSLLTQAFTQLFGQAPNATTLAALSPMLRDLQGALQHVRLSQVVYADSSARNEPDYYLTLPWQVGEEKRTLELLLKRRQQQTKEQQDARDIWLLSMRLQLTRIGPILARVRWNGEQASIMLYTDNDAASRWLSSKTARLQQQLVANEVQVHNLEVQTGRIPATLAPEPNQLVRVRV